MYDTSSPIRADRVRTTLPTAAWPASDRIGGSLGSVGWSAMGPRNHRPRSEARVHVHDRAELGRDHPHWFPALLLSLLPASWFARRACGWPAVRGNTVAHGGGNADMRRRAPRHARALPGMWHGGGRGGPVSGGRGRGAGKRRSRSCSGGRGTFLLILWPLLTCRRRHFLPAWTALPSGAQWLPAGAAVLTCRRRGFLPARAYLPSWHAGLTFLAPWRYLPACELHACRGGGLSRPGPGITGRAGWGGLTGAARGG